MKDPKRLLSRVVRVVGGALLLVALGRLAAKARPLLRSTDSFVTWPSDPRVKYEPGAEKIAAVVAAAMNDAVRVVEERQYRPFARAPVVYVCASVATYASYGGDARSGGYVLNQRLFLSPKPENTAQRIPGVLTHELSHLHLEQQMGSVHWMREFPVWFQEGLAAFVSDGGGAENVTEDEGRRAIAEGRVFAPETTGGLTHRSTASTYGLSPHLFYREGAMFIGSLERRDAGRFRQFLLDVEDGRSMEPAFESAYGETVDVAWDKFVRDCSTP